MWELCCHGSIMVTMAIAIHHYNIIGIFPNIVEVGYSICLMDSVLFMRAIRFVIDINTPQWCDVKLVMV